MHNKIIIPPRTKKSNGFKDITGKRYGRIVVMSHAGSEKVGIDKNGKEKFKSVWNIKCDCGNKKIIRGADLGIKTVSCGCFSSEKTIEFNKKTKTKESYNAFSDVWQSYKQGAKKRKLKFELSKDEFLKITKENCFYCGSGPFGKRKSRTKGKIPEYIYNGIDRVDSDLGYIKSNIVPCCKLCNIMKRDMKINLFKDQIIKIYINLKLSAHQEETIRYF